jgi:hypothetical protein
MFSLPLFRAAATKGVLGRTFFSVVVSIFLLVFIDHEMVTVLAAHEHFASISFLKQNIWHYD